jgi:hypothetical protein
MLGKFPIFHIVVISLCIVAIWDWTRYFDRSRTLFCIAGLSVALLVSATVATLVHHPQTPALVDQGLAGVALIGLTLALVQLYRSEQTVLTIIRGWMYAVAILAVLAAYQGLTSDRPVLNGPLPSAAYLASAMVVGVLLMPIGFALEKDHRLRWTYPCIAVLATWVAWTTHRSVALGCCLIVLVIWLATFHWLTASILTVITVAGIAVFRRYLPLRFADVGMEPPLDASVHAHLIGVGWRILVDSHFLGVGPGGLADVWPEAWSAYTGPYSAFIELTSQYGLGVGVVVMCALLGALVWCVKRLWATRGQPLRSADRAGAVWLAVMIVMAPVTTSIQAHWLSFPLSALAVATWAMLARHIESPQGRALLWSAGPSAAEETIGPPQFTSDDDGETDQEADSAQTVRPGLSEASGDSGQTETQRIPRDHRTGERDQPSLG